MKLLMPTVTEIRDIANATEMALLNSNNRVVNVHVIENAIRKALDIVIDGLDVQIGEAYCHHPRPPRDR